MSAEQLENALQQLSLVERRRFVEWLDTHRVELVGGASPAEIEAAQQQEVLRRLAETESNPSQLQPFEDGDVETMFREFGDARAQKVRSQGLIFKSCAGILWY